MKTDPPYDATFERIPDKMFRFLYQDAKVNVAYMSWVMQYRFNLADFDDYLQEHDWEVSKTGKENLDLLLLRRSQALQAFTDRNFELAFAWINFLNATMLSGKRQDYMLPLSLTGRKFTTGRKPGAVGPVRAAVRRQLKRLPQTTAAKIWDSLKVKPPKGLTFYDRQDNKYIEIDMKAIKGKLPPEAERFKEVKYRRFLNIVSEERRLLEPPKA
jgi:hypothetical protein